MKQILSFGADRRIIRCVCFPYYCPNVRLGNSVNPGERARMEQEGGEELGRRPREGGGEVGGEMGNRVRNETPQWSTEHDCNTYRNDLEHR